MKNFRAIIVKVTFDPIKVRENIKIIMNDKRVNIDRSFKRKRRVDIPMLLRLESSPRKITLR